MRIVIRCEEAKLARAAQDALAAAGVGAAALPGMTLRPAPNGEDVTVIPALEAPEKARKLATGLRSLSPPPFAVLAGLNSANPPALGLAGDPAFDGVIALNAPPKLLAAQIQAHIRGAIAQDERRRRAATAAELKAPAPTPPELRKLKALYIGAPSPMFLYLERALSQNGGLVAAAFSSFTGFDHLHDEPFDAVVLNGAQDPSTAVSLCAALRRNATLYNLPTMVVTKPGDTATSSAAIDRGACAVATLNAPCGPSLGWLFEAIRRERRRREAEHDNRAYRDIMGEARTGLFKRPAFETHLARLAADHHISGRTLALTALRVLPAHGASQPSEEVWKRGFNEIASLARRLIRETDSGAAIGGDLIVLALPATDLRGAKRTAERVASVSECTAFASGDGGAGPLVFEQSAVELQPGESGAGMLARALRALDVESISA
ncbi:hypothetical protein [Terricaulis sp.]|uniref:hypothetical protein n=1 Tax=Terricaulis sp. TaxID=2768686 RepID=UPI003783E256